MTKNLRSRVSALESLKQPASGNVEFDLARMTDEEASRLFRIAGWLASGEVPISSIPSEDLHFVLDAPRLGGST